MTTKNTSSKVLKATMVGAVALTPVLAVGLNANQAKAATEYAGVDQLIINLKAAYNALNATQKGHLKDAKDSIEGVLDKEGNMDSYLKQLLENPDNQDARDVVADLVTLLADSYSVENIETAFKKFDNLTNDKLNSALGTEDLKKVDFVNFLVYVQSNVFERLGTSQTYSSYFEIFEDVLYDSLDNTNHRKVAVAIAKTVKEDNVKGVLKSIVDEADVTDDQKKAFVTLAEKYKAAITPATPPVGGGGGVIPPTPPTTGEGTVGVDAGAVVSNPQSVIDAIKKADKVEELVVKVSAGTTAADIPATILNALSEKNSNAVVVLQFGDVAYELPVDAFDLTAIAKDLDVASAELKLNVSVKKVDNPLAGKAAYKVLADAFDFNVSVVAPGGKSVALNVFPTPIKRSVPGANELNPLTTVGVTVDAKGNVTAVPTYVVDGKKSANLYRSTNSVYTLIEHSKSFTDITGGTSWAEEFVNPLASRMVVNGVTATEYAPTKMITRGEFAAILSRGLGIVAMDKTANVFADVSASQAFNKNGEIAAVVEAGIVAGFTDGTFRPYEEITRDQAAIMISRAIDYVGADKVTFDTKKALTAFKDNKDIGAASRKHVERVYQAGLLDGYLDDTFRPNADANRAQMAKIIYNFLAEIKFIN